jgi:thiol-disulfide isomerase/thioredoxin
MQSTFAVQLLADDPYARIMQGVQKTEFAGTDVLDGNQPAHHLKFTQDDADWEMWVAAEGDPVLLKVSTDMSKALAKSAGQLGERFKDMKMVSSEMLHDWKFNAPLDAVAFTFTPPEGAKKVDNLLGGLDGGEEEPSPLLGKPAPPIKLALLEGGEFDLASHAGTSPVMVDFWATWCGPCVEELPILVKVADEYREKGVVFCALNQAEDADTIRKFLEEQKLSTTIALDSESKVGEAYGLSGIPMLVLIDKGGVVQSVHVGYSAGIEEALRKELDDLLAGKNLAEEKLAKAAQAAEPIEPTGLEEVWSADGRYSSVTVHQPSGAIFVASSRGQCMRFDDQGQAQDTFNAPQQVNALRAARLRPGSDAQLLGFKSPWGETVVAMEADGKKLWQETGGQGIDDVWPADLDADGQDEIIVGFNGSTGLHVFAADGARRWEYTDIGNVWHVAAGDVVGDAAIEVVATSAAGQVHILDADGKHLNDLRAPFYANMIRVAKFSPDKPHASIIIVGSGDSGEQIAALDGEGAVLWTRDVPASTNHCDSLSIAPNGAWAAAGLRGGLVIAVETAKGEIIAQVDGMGERPDVAWHAASGSPSPLLLVASGKYLKAFRFTTKAE